jgi:hypothetical protein
LTLVGCATTTAHGDAAKVRITANTAAVQGCRFIANVEGNDHWNGGLA